MPRIVIAVIEEVLKEISYLKKENTEELIYINASYAPKLSRIEFKQLIMSQNIMKSS